jgi:hypothetical protein
MIQEDGFRQRKEGGEGRKEGRKEEGGFGIEGARADGSTIVVPIFPKTPEV